MNPFTFARALDAQDAVRQGAAAGSRFLGGQANPRRVVSDATAQAIDRFRGVLGVSLLILLGLLALAALAQVLVGLAPLRAMQRALNDVREGRAQRLQGNFPSEVQPLINDFNQVLATNAEVVARAILARCDALDGLSDGIVNDVEACRTAFDPQRDVPTCKAARDGSCLTAAQKSVLAAVHQPVRNAAGERVYSGFPFDPGIRHPGWAEWRFRNSVRTARNPVSVGFIFSSPPVADLTMATDTRKSAAYALAFDLDRDGARVFATSGVYTENALAFMGTLEAPEFDRLRERGGKVLVLHGTADPIFSSDHTQAWYRALDAHQRGGASSFARLFLVPGQGHSRGGPATDQYDGLATLVDWVEQGRAPERIVASARGPGNPAGANTDVPASWSPTRTRPLCPYPLLARYTAGDPESATSFTCQR